MATRFAHANLRVRDGARSVAFYRALGLRVIGCLVLDPELYLLYLGTEAGESVGIELTINATSDPAYDRSPGSGHIAVTTDALDDLLVRLAEHGIRPLGPPYHPAKRQDIRICFVEDPDGHRVELIDGPRFMPADPLPAAIAVSANKAKVSGG